MIRDLQDTKDAVDARIGGTAVQMFTKGGAVAGGDNEEQEDDDHDTDDVDDDQEEDSEEGSEEGSEDENSEEEDEEEHVPQRQAAARPEGSCRKAHAAAAAYRQDSDDGGGDQDSESDDDELFQIKGSDKSARAAPSAGGPTHDRTRVVEGGINALDSPYFDLDGPEAALQRWQGGATAAVQELKHRIVTGGEAAFNDAYLRSLHDGVGDHEAQEEDDDDVYDDFEDVELGQVFSGKQLVIVCVHA